MFYQHYRLYSNLLLVADILAGFLGLSLAYYLRYRLVEFVPGQFQEFFNPELLPFREYLFYFLLILPCWVFVLMLTQRYSELVRLSMRQQIFRALRFVFVLGFLIGFLSYSFKLLVSRPVFFGFLVLSLLLLIANRFLLHWALRSRNINEHNQIKLVIAGTDERARRVGRLLENYKIWGYDVVGYLTTEEDELLDGNLPVVGSVDDLPGLLQGEIVADEIIFMGSPTKSMAKFEEVVHVCEDLGVRTRLAADFFPASASRVSLDFLENLPLITFSTAPEHTVAIVAKRIVDFTIASLLLILLSPLMLITAAVIKFTSPGPVFYSQTRCGLYMRRFKLIKFRTMVDGAEDKLWEISHLNEMSGPVFKMRNDPRVTPVGHFLRKFSIDELPQLWNVIKGEMSLVGPRAPLCEEVRHYLPKQRRRLSVKPGITCLWQVSGRNDVDFNRWMELDLQYIDNWSFWLDIRILLKTLPAVFTGRGAR